VTSSSAWENERKAEATVESRSAVEAPAKNWKFDLLAEPFMES
jgi:hypothetical protein